MSVPFPKMEPYPEFLKTAKDLLEKCSFHYEKSKTLQKSIEETAEKYKALNAKCKTSLDTVKTESIALKKSCQDLKADLDVTTKEKNSLNEECKKLRLSLNDVNEKNTKLEKECAASELSYNEVVNENVNLKNSLSKVKNENTELIKKCNDLTISLNDTLAKVKNENTELIKKCNDLTSSLNDTLANLKDSKGKCKLLNQRINTLKKERKITKENLAKQMSEVLGTVFKPANSSTASAENIASDVVLSSDDEDDLSKVVSSSKCEDKVNILPKPKSVGNKDGSEKTIQKGDYGSSNQLRVSSDKGVSHQPSPPAAAVSIKNNQEKSINVSPRKSNLIIPANAISSIPTPSSKTGILSTEKERIRLSPCSVAGIPSTRSTSAISPKKENQDVERSPGTVISTPENKSKTTISPMKGKQESNPSGSPINPPNESSRTIAFSPTSLQRNNQSQIPPVSTHITTEAQFKDNPALLNNNEKCNRSSLTSILKVPKISNLTTSAASPRKDDIVHENSLVSPILTSNNQSTVKLVSLKDNERNIRSSPVSIASFHQNRQNQGISPTSPKKDNRDICGSPGSAVSVLENQSTTKTVTVEEKGNIPIHPVVDPQSNPAIITSMSLRSPVTSENKSNACNKEQSTTFTTVSKNNQNITSSTLRTQRNVSPKSPPPSNISRTSLLLTRAQDRGCQIDYSPKGRLKTGSNFFIGWDKNEQLSGHTGHADNISLQSDSIIESPTANENKEPAHNKEQNSKDLMLHSPNQRRLSSKTPPCNEDSTSGIISTLDSEEECVALPSSSRESVPKGSLSFGGQTIRGLLFPIVCIPRVDEVPPEVILSEIHLSYESRKSKRRSIIRGAGPSKRRKSIASEN